LVVIIISPGEDETVFGFNACRKPDDEKRDRNDVIDISEIVDIFSEKKCFALRGKPKMFFFDCSQISISNSFEINNFYSNFWFILQPRNH
jgi:hypothetical protein